MEANSARAANPSATFALSWGVLAAALIPVAAAFPFGWTLLIRLLVAPFASVFAFGYAVGSWNRPTKWITRVAVLLALVPFLYWIISVTIFLATTDPS